MMRTSRHAPLVYWCPGVQSPGELADAALRRRLVDGPGQRQRQKKGPGEGLGMLYCRFPGTRLAYQPERQTWHPLESGVWLGIDRDFAPAAVQRPALLAGAAVTLGAHLWVLPVCHPEVSTCTLPLVPWPVNGVWLQRVMREHEPLAAMARHLVEQYRAALLEQGGSFQVAADTVYRFLADVIATNYDLSLTELLALEIFDAASVQEALRQVTGWARFLGQLAQQMETAADGEHA